MTLHGVIAESVVQSRRASRQNRVLRRETSKSIERKAKSKWEDVGRLAQSILIVGLIMLIVGVLLQIIFPSREENEKWKWRDGYFPIGSLIEEAKYAFVIGGLLALSLEFTSRREQLRTLRDHISQIVDKVDTGIDQIVVKMDRGMDSIMKGATLANFHMRLVDPDTPELVHEVGTRSITNTCKAWHLARSKQGSRSHLGTGPLKPRIYSTRSCRLLT